MANFVPTKGFENCPKCGGWQVLDKTKRKRDGWPSGPLVFEDCDNCLGKGEIKASVWPPKPVKVAGVEIEDNVALPEPEAKPNGWAIFNK